MKDISVHNQAIELNDSLVLSYRTREGLLGSTSYRSIEHAMHLIIRTPLGRWTAVIIGSRTEENAAWFLSARADGKRFYWICPQ